MTGNAHKTDTKMGRCIFFDHSSKQMLHDKVYATQLSVSHQHFLCFSDIVSEVYNLQSYPIYQPCNLQSYPMHQPCNLQSDPIHQGMLPQSYPIHQGMLPSVLSNTPRHATFSPIQCIKACNLQS